MDRGHVWTDIERRAHVASAGAEKLPCDSRQRSSDSSQCYHPYPMGKFHPRDHVSVEQPQYLLDQERRYKSPTRSCSEDSNRPQHQSITSSPSFQKRTSGDSTLPQVAQLYIQPSATSDGYNKYQQHAVSTGNKRYATTELESGRQPPSPGAVQGSCFRSVVRPGAVSTTQTKKINSRGGQAGVFVHPRPAAFERSAAFKGQHQDSGYVSGRNTLEGDVAKAYPYAPNAESHKRDPRDVRRKVTPHSLNQGPQKPTTQSRFPGLILEPDSSPISQDQLAAEVKGIYAGLVMVEAKCINIDAAQAADPKADLGSEQWQALIALHRTLLYEHHDFLMATQHPSANDALRGLATKYSMPARMWKHGIHAFLEVLRHRRPASQDYMLAFIYLAYQMMALLYETVESFKDTWIECLGDLARYRMAIEEDKEQHTSWGGVAARWYTLASDRHAAIGRLNHHLGILERPSVRKMYFYAKSLTCLLPFPNAKDSMATLCGPILHDNQLLQNSHQPAEARIMHFHALLFSKWPLSAVDQACLDALSFFERENSAFIHRTGVSLAVTNIAGLLEWGVSTNAQRHCFATAVNIRLQSTRPLGTAQSTPDRLAPQDQTSFTPSALSFTNACFNLALRHNEDRSAIQDVLPFVHVMLGWFQGVVTARSLVHDRDTYYMFCALLDGDIAWGSLCLLLNTLLVYYPLNERVVSCAEQGVFLSADKPNYRPLPEDYLIRGLVWLQFFFSPNWFDGKLAEDGRSIEDDSTRTMRAERVLWLGLWLARNCDYISFDPLTRRFSAPASDRSHPGMTTPPAEPATVVSGNLTPQQDGGSPSSATLSARSDPYVDSSSEGKDGWAKVVSRQKRKSQEPAVLVFDEDTDMSTAVQ